MGASSWTLSLEPSRGSQTHLTPRLGAAAPVMVTFRPIPMPMPLLLWVKGAVVSQLGLGTVGVTEPQAAGCEMG